MAERSIWTSRIYRYFQTAVIFYVYGITGLALTFMMIVGSDKHLFRQTVTSVQTPGYMALLYLIGSFTALAVGGMLLIRVTKRGYLGKSPFMTRIDRFIFARADRTFQSEVSQMEIELLRAQITRKVYGQVMDQQQRGLLCPNCKGQDPGQQRSA